MANAGTAILIKKTIAYHDLLPYADPAIQATIIRVTGPSRDIIVAAFYCPPKHNIKLGHYEKFFQMLGPCFLTGEYYNSKNTIWGSQLTTTKGRELAKVIQAQNYSYITIVSPTYWPTNTNKLPNILDFFILRGISTAYANIQASYDLTSDHSPIIATISRHVVTRKPAPTLHTPHTNWTTYKTERRNKVHPEMNLKTREDIETATEVLLTPYSKHQKQQPLQVSHPLQIDIYPPKSNAW
jgi:hypothetical protein